MSNATWEGFGMTHFTSSKPCDEIVGPDELGNPAKCGKTPIAVVAKGFGPPDPTTPGDLLYANYCEEHHPKQDSAGGAPISA